MEHVAELQKNVTLYRKINYTLPFVLFWTLIVPFYKSKGIDFTQIALLQTIGSVVSMALEVPLGWYSDRHGYRKTLLISAFGYLGGTAFLIFGHTMPTLLISELLFALAMSAKSGADTAIFYGSLERLEQTDRYLDIQSRISQKQSVIRFCVYIIAPVLYSFLPSLPFLLSLIPYGLLTYFTFQFTELPRTEIGQKDKPATTVPKNKCRVLETVATNVKTFFSLNRTFTLLSVFSMLMLIIVSNYSQFFAPYLESVGVDIKFYGFVNAGAMLASFLGARWISLWRQTPRFSVLTLCGSVMCLLLIGSSLIDTLWSVILFYFAMNLLHTQFCLYLSKSLNEVIPGERRATMLSLSNIFDQFGSVLCDPLIGLGLDRLGFKNVYCLIGLVGLGAFFLLWLFLRNCIPDNIQTAC